MEKVEVKLDVMIKKLCKEQSLTIAELSRRSGVPKQTIHNWTMGQSKCDFIYLYQIANTLKSDINTLIFGKNNRT